MVKIQRGRTSVVAAPFTLSTFVFDSAQLQLNIPRSGDAGVALTSTVASAVVHHILSTAGAHPLISSADPVQPSCVVRPEWGAFNAILSDCKVAALAPDK